ncbi:MAG: SPOR domain-containing protein, partial [Spirochaetaceae bacterium]|nr:SPOR domain-containing protein [Spirochaetaceae bacterium]
FRNRENAQDLIQRLTDAGFKASVQEELRQSGTLYFAVIVKENPDGNMGAQLKNAGFECYPVFE